MQRWIWTVVLLMAPPGLVSAQATSERRGYGYVFVAPGVATDGESAAATLHVGVGGERFVYRGLGIGGEIGYAGALLAPGAGIGVASVNSSYNFRRASKLAPFVTGGYSLLFRSGTLNVANFGGGINYWFRERLGLRLELRDHVAVPDSSAHAVGLRIGLAFR